MRLPSEIPLERPVNFFRLSLKSLNESSVQRIFPFFRVNPKKELSFALVILLLSRFTFSQEIHKGVPSVSLTPKDGVLMYPGFINQFPIWCFSIMKHLLKRVFGPHLRDTWGFFYDLSIRGKSLPNLNSWYRIWKYSAADQKSDLTCLKRRVIKSRNNSKPYRSTFKWNR